jgi:hypothetical protein
MKENKSSQTNQITSLFFNLRTILLLIVVGLVLEIGGVLLDLLFHNAGISIIFTSLWFALIWLWPYWQPAYTIMYMIAGNKDISPILQKHQFKWWHYISPSIKVIFLIYLFYIGLKLVLK